MTKLVILTLNWNGESKLKKLIPSLKKATEGIETEWYVRDNGSIDNSLSILKNENSIKTLEISHNKDNFSQGVNSCFVESKAKDGDLVLLLNNDVVFKNSSSIKNMIKIISNKDVGIVGAKLSYDNDKIQHAGVVFNNKKMPFHLDDNKTETKHHRQNREFQAVTGACLLTRAVLFKNLSSDNGLDEKFHWGFDDVAACLAMKYQLNKKVVYCGSTDIMHESSATLKINPVNQVYLKQNALRLISLFGKHIKVDKDSYTNNHLVFK